MSRESPDPFSLLPSLSRAELERIVRRRLAEGDEELGELILFLRKEQAGTRSAAAIVERMVTRYQQNSYGYVDNPPGLAKDLRGLYGMAEEAVFKGDGLFAVRLLTTAVERAAPHAFEGTDEEGELADAVEKGFEQLLELSRNADVDPEALRELGVWAAAGVDSRWAQDGDSWDMACIDLVAEAARTADEVRDALGLLARFTENPIPSDWSRSYKASRAAVAVVGLLTRTGDSKGRRDYIEAHLVLRDIRKLAIDEAMVILDYRRAVDLCREGMRVSRENDLSGIEKEFHQRLIKVLDAAGEGAEAAREFESLMVDAFSLDKYEEFKKRHSDRSVWETARGRIIESLKTKRNSYALAVIYDMEGMHEPLLALAEKDGFLFHDHLETIGRVYPERAASFLKDRIEGELRRTHSRSTYASLAESILRYGNYAGPGAADSLFNALLAAYPTRRAMREEFEGVRRNIARPRGRLSSSQP